MLSRSYIASPTAARYMQSNAFVRCLFGPVGCGKTVTLLVDAIVKSFEQERASDGIRYVRGAIIRNTYPELKSTTIKTWQDWFDARYFGRIKYDSPISLTARVKDLQLEIFFIALDSEQDIKKLLSLELTWAVINEARFVSKSLFDALIMRLGRYPAMDKGGCTKSWLGMDTNPPDDTHWIYNLFEIDKPDNYAIFKYPAAIIREHNGEWKINPAAENLDNIKNSHDYYLRQIAGKDREWIKVYLEGKYGTVIEGRAVYLEYNDSIHCTNTIKYVPHLTLLLGWDFGLTPACVVAQLTNDGRMIVLDELCAESVGITQFAKNVVIPFLNKNYKDWQNNYVSVGDPSGSNRVQTDERASISILNDLGILTEEAKTNLIVPRIDAVTYFLTGIKSGQPAFLLSERCRILRKGFLGGYHYKKIKVSNEEAHKDIPEKNSCSHPHDALQYIALYAQDMISCHYQFKDNSVYDLVNTIV